MHDSLTEIDSINVHETINYESKPSFPTEQTNRNDVIT